MSRDKADRYFKNPYPRGPKDDPHHILDSTKQGLSEEYVDKAWESIRALQKTLDVEVLKEEDSGDYSVYTGTSGYVYLYLHLAQVLPSNPSHLQRAREVLEKVLPRLKGRRLTFLCGDAGPLTLAALLYHTLGQQADRDQAIHKLKAMREAAVAAHSDLPDELLYGRAGYLYALLLLQNKLGRETVEDGLVRAVITAILDSGRALARRERWPCPLMFEWHDKKYIGAAHGMVGILFLLLQAKEYLTSEELQEVVRPSIDFVCGLQLSSGNVPSSHGSPNDLLVHWCHGAPGATFLFAKAYQVYGSEKYLSSARQCGKCVWERGLLKKGYSLCHGTSGNGYALLYLYQVTGEVVYLYQAGQFGRWCQDYGTHGCRTPDRPFSLFEGLAGNLHFLVSLLQPTTAKFPAFVL